MKLRNKLDDFITSIILHLLDVAEQDQEESEY